MNNQKNSKPSAIRSVIAITIVIWIVLITIVVIFHNSETEFFNSGYQLGYEDGKDNGYTLGYNNGFELGVESVFVHNYTVNIFDNGDLIIGITEADFKILDTEDKGDYYEISLLFNNLTYNTKIFLNFKGDWTGSGIEGYPFRTTPAIGYFPITIISNEYNSVIYFKVDDSGDLNMKILIYK